MANAPLEGTLCSVCGEKLFGHYFEGEAGPLCGLCRRAAPRFRRAVAYGAYEGELRDLVHLLKYDGIRPAARVLGLYLNQALVQRALAAPSLVIPVPLAAGKQRARGFNQAEEIARAFIRERSESGILLDTISLVRTRDTVSQTGLTREQRKANLRGAFAVRGDRLQGRAVLLVDDVMTTGATAGECARVLLRAGAKEVYVATVARATRELASVPVLAAGAIAGGTTGHA
jgi:ComF family protein